MSRQIPKAHYTFADCLVWDESTRIEIINGEAFVMSMPLRIHQEILGELSRQLANFLEGKTAEVIFAPLLFAYLRKTEILRRAWTRWYCRISPLFAIKVSWMSTAARGHRTWL